MIAFYKDGAILKDNILLSDSPLHGKNIMDIILPPLGIDSDPNLRDKIFSEAPSSRSLCLVPSIWGRFFTNYWDQVAFKWGIPCQYSVKRIGDFYLASVSVMDFYMERNKGQISNDMLAFIDDRDEIKMFCPHFSLALTPKHVDGRLFMHHLTYSPSWKALASREAVVCDYHRDLLNRPETDWRPETHTQETPEAEWLPFKVGVWDLTKDKYSIVESPETAFLTRLAPLDQADHDVRISFAIDIRAFAGRTDSLWKPRVAGVMFHVNIYDAGSETTTPDVQGYSLSLRLTFSGKRPIYAIALKKFTRFIQAENLSDNMVENLLQRGVVNLGFEKTGGAFRVTADGEPLATLIDTFPIVGQNHNNYFGLLGTAEVAFKHIGIETRPTQFDIRRIPSSVADIEFPKLPGRIYEARIDPQATSINPQLRSVYLKDVTYSRELLKKLNDTLSVIEDELDTAQHLQNLMTSITLPRDPAIGFESFHKPSRQIGGDLFDVKDLGDGRFAALIYDVSGHGIAASLLSAMAKMAFENAFKSTASPARILEIVNADICKVAGLSMFVTAFLAILDTWNKTLVYARAGHCYPALFDRHNPKSPCLLLREGDRILGNASDVKYHEFKVPLRPGNRLLLYTDGVIEMRDSHDRFFGQKALFQIIGDSLSMDLESAKAAVLKVIRAFISDQPYEDDLTFLLIDIA